MENNTVRVRGRGRRIPNEEIKLGPDRPIKNGFLGLATMTNGVQGENSQLDEASGVNNLLPKVSVLGRGRGPTPTQNGHTEDLISIPIRKNKNGGGNLGRRIQIEVNFLPLDFSRVNGTAIHYDISFEPDHPKRFLKNVFEKFRLENFADRYPAFDGVKNVYSSEPLIRNSCIVSEFLVLNSDTRIEKKYKVTMQYTSNVDLTSLQRYMECGSSLQIPQDALQCVDIVIRNAIAGQMHQVGRSFFTRPSGTVVDLSDGLELWHGMFCSAIIGWKPYLNVDVAHKGFPKEQLITAYLMRKGIDLDREMGAALKKETMAYLQGIKIQYELPNDSRTRRSYRVNGLKESARTQRFTDENGRSLTVEKYFHDSKKVFLKYPDLPCIWVGSISKTIFVPMELCTIQSKHSQLKKLSDLQTRNMIRMTASRTDVRKAKINLSVEQSEIHRNRGISEFGLRIGHNFEKIDARILDPPTLQYGSNIKEVPKVGVWRPNKFLKPANLYHWSILRTDVQIKASEIQEFVRQIQCCGKDFGMEIRNYRRSDCVDHRDSRFGDNLLDYFSKAKRDNMQIVFVLVANSGDSYHQVKIKAELNLGVLTQCVKASTISRMNRSTATNIMLKVNTKLNGMNHIVITPNHNRPSVLNQSVIMIGADVTHPSPEQIADKLSPPSVVGVAASYEPSAFRYNMTWRLQPPKVEIIEDLQSIVMEQLRKFRTMSNQIPQHIIYWRDGVSEGQFAQVLNSELTAIRNACTSLSANYKPLVTMLVIQKRHHTRFFPVDTSVGKNMNVPPGTVVDTHITHPTELDFYLLSHASIQGVARPTKYRRLWDDADMAEDDIEELAYYLCHMFSRCTRAVSYPAPTYYAHLAAYRGRVYMEGAKIKLDNLPEEYQKRNIEADFHKAQPMFFV